MPNSSKRTRDTLKPVSVSLVDAVQVSHDATNYVAGVEARILRLQQNE
jgi:hypothetical protein